jgi:hypothetical protein
MVVPLLVASAYFLSFYFAATALVPPASALSLASWVTCMALLALLRLRHMGMDEAGAPLGLLLMLPILCLFVGVIWWVVRWLGLWG